MESIGNFEAQEQIKEWAQCKGNEIFNCFQKFRTDKKTEFNGQFVRLYGIKFGAIDPALAKFVIEQVPEGSGATLAMSLGVFEGCFNILFETNDGKGNLSYYRSSGVEDHGRIYDAEEASEYFGTAPAKNFGILPIVRNHLCVNWFGHEPGDIESLFLAQKLTNLKGIEQAITEDIKKLGSGQKINLSGIIEKISDPFYRVAVRAMKYPITGYNLGALRSLLEESQERSISISFGLNPADFYYNDDTFSVILEVGEPGVETQAKSQGGGGTTYLDFVFACPPRCEDD